MIKLCKRPALPNASLRRRVLASILSILAAGVALADDGDAEFKRSLASNLEAVGGKIIALAEATDAETFSWRPTPEVRSVSQVYMHIIGSNFQLPALLGATAPEGLDIPDSGPYALGIQRAQWEVDFVTKEPVTEILRRSFEYAIQAIPEIDDLEAEVTPFGFKASKRDYLLILMAHAHEHLGQSIAYARSAGIVPPWSQAAPARQDVESSAVYVEGWARGKTMKIDRFGNLETSFVGADLDRLGLQTGDFLTLAAGDTAVDVFLGESFFDVQMGEWVAFLSQSGRLMVGRSYASAASTLDVSVDAGIQIQASGSTP